MHIEADKDLFPHPENGGNIKIAYKYRRLGDRLHRDIYRNESQVNMFLDIYLCTRQNFANITKSS